MERKNLLRELIYDINNSIEINEIKKNIVTKVGKALNANRCYIRIFDSTKNEFWALDEYSEYLSSPEIESFVNVEPTEINQDWTINPLKKRGENIIPDIEEFIKKNPKDSIHIENYKKKFNIKSVYAIPIFYAKDLIGVIVLQYTKTRCFLKNEDLNFIRTLAAQIGISLYNAKLYKDLKLKAERELCLRKINELLISSININEIKKNIVNYVGKFFKADRCFIRLFGSEYDEFLLLDEHSEYLSSPEIKSIVDIKPTKKTHGYIKNLMKQKKDNIIYDIDQKIEQDIENAESLKILKEIYGFKSDYGIYIYYGEELLGALVLHYISSVRHLKPEDIRFLRIIANQIGINLHNAKLYNDLKQKVERELFLRKITELLITSLDIDEIEQQIIINTGKLLNADRVFIINFDKVQNSFFPIKNEYLSSKEVKSMKEVDLEKNAPEFVEHLKENCELFISDTEEYILKNNYQGTEIEECFNFYEVKSSFCVPITNGEIFLGRLVIHSCKEKKIFTKNDIDFIKIIANQAGIALYQAELFKKLIQNADREKFLSEVISITKGAFGLEEIITLISEKIKKFYRVEKVIINLNSDEKIQLISSKPVILENEDINLLERIIDNVSIAVRESNLYTKTRFMADVSHELRTPVAIIEGYVNNLFNKQDYSKKTVDKYLKIIQKNTDRITHIIENLIMLSQLEDDNDLIPVEEVKVGSLIKNVIQIQQNFGDNKNIEFETHYDDSLTIRANEILIEQALLNLVQNAVHYSGDNSKIIIRAIKTNKKVCISVQDFGCGIEEHHLKNIFKRFYRADQSRSRETGGSGLGLSIVEKIVETYKGKVTVKSEIGKGSTFSIEIPCF